MTPGPNAQPRIDFSARDSVLEQLREVLFDREFATRRVRGVDGHLEIRAEHASPWSLRVRADGRFVVREGERDQRRGRLASGTPSEVCLRIAELLGG